MQTRANRAGHPPAPARDARPGPPGLGWREEDSSCVRPSPEATVLAWEGLPPLAVGTHLCRVLTRGGPEKSLGELSVQPGVAPGWARHRPDGGHRQPSPGYTRLGPGGRGSERACVPEPSPSWSLWRWPRRRCQGKQTRIRPKLTLAGAGHRDPASGPAPRGLHAAPHPPMTRGQCAAAAEGAEAMASFIYTRHSPSACHVWVAGTRGCGTGSCGRFSRVATYCEAPQH